MEKTFQWHPYDPKINGKDQGLQNHFYYLVTHKKYGTPMKAKWHDEGCWEVIGETSEKNPFCYESGHYWDWEENHPILAWMDLPDVYKEEKPLVLPFCPMIIDSEHNII